MLNFKDHVMEEEKTWIAEKCLLNAFFPISSATKN